LNKAFASVREGMLADMNDEELRAMLPV